MIQLQKCKGKGAEAVLIKCTRFQKVCEGSRGASNIPEARWRYAALGEVPGSPLQQTWLLTCTGLGYQLQRKSSLSHFRSLSCLSLSDSLNAFRAASGGAQLVFEDLQSSFLQHKASATTEASRLPVPSGL